MELPFLVLVAVVCGAAAVVWGRSARHRYRVMRRVEAALGEGDPAELSRATFFKDALATSSFGAAALATAIVALVGSYRGVIALVILLVPAIGAIAFGRNFTRQARLAQNRWELERKAEETLSQDDLAPKRWAERLAPEILPDVKGFELGRVYQPGDGLMAGDFYDVFPVGRTRVAAVIGDVTGHGIDASITAFQAKYLLRVFLQQFRDPAQALEQLNTQMSALDHGEEFISLCVVVFDTDAGSLRYCSAGHPAAWLWHERDVMPLNATGPLLMLDPDGDYFSREITLNENDLVLMYTDGLAEARSGDDLFGEERIAAALRRDPGAAPEVLCKALLEAAKDFASDPITDDVAVLAIRRQGDNDGD